MKKFLLLFVLSAFLKVNAQNINNINELIVTGNYTEAINNLNQMITADSGNAALYGKLAYCFSMNENFDNAIIALNKGLEINPDDSRLIMMLGDNYMACDKYAEAKTEYQKYLQQDLDNISGKLKLAKAFIALKEWRAGEIILKGLIETNGSIAVYYELIAGCMEQLKENDNAIINLEIACRINPKNVHVSLRLCNLYFKTQRYMSAVRVAGKALVYYPENSDLWRAKAEGSYRLDNYLEAIYSYKNAVAFGDTAYTIFRNIGISFYASDKPDSAFFYLDKAFSMNDDDCLTALYLGKVLNELDMAGDAETYFKKVEAIQMNNYVVESFINLGALYQQKKDYKTCLDYFNMALKYDPGRKSVLFRIGATYDEGFKDKAAALKYYSQYTMDSIDIDPKLYDYAVKRINEIKVKE
jgi:tetratricopeptide (TPR) repeat protein